MNLFVMNGDLRTLTITLASFQLDRPQGKPSDVACLIKVQFFSFLLLFLLSCLWVTSTHLVPVPYRFWGRLLYFCLSPPGLYHPELTSGHPEGPALNTLWLTRLQTSSEWSVTTAIMSMSLGSEPGGSLLDRDHK